MNDSNPFESPLHESEFSGPEPPKKRSWRVFISLMVIVTIGLLIILLMPARRCAREASRRAGCINNIRQIQLALLNYESAFGHFPPAYTVDADGNRLHSWRTLILPFIEESRLQESIDFTKPWDHPANATAREASVTPYHCPSAWCGDGMTTYLALTGPNHGMHGSDPRKSSELEAPSRTVMIIDVPSDQAVHWMSPYDADEELLNKLKADAKFQHDGVFMVAFMNNQVLSFPISELEAFRKNAPQFGSEFLESL